MKYSTGKTAGFLAVLLLILQAMPSGWASIFCGKPVSLPPRRSSGWKYGSGQDPISLRPQLCSAQGVPLAVTQWVPTEQKAGRNLTGSNEANDWRFDIFGIDIYG